MGNLWFNIRLGNYHYQLTNKWGFSRVYNEYHADNPKRFQVHNAFGIYFDNK